MATLTIKQAKELGQEMVLGTAIKTKVTTIVQTLYTAHCGGDIKADKPLIALWEQCATDKPTLAVIRAIFNRVTKAVHKELGIDKPAMCVKDSKLVEVQKRGGNGGGAEGSGEGSGESTASDGANVMSPTGKALPPIEALAEAIFQVSAFAEECVKVEKNSDLANAMINADIALCEIKTKLLEALEPLDQAA
jgi:hypothetical protein